MKKKSKEGYFKILENAGTIYHGYTDAKYHAYYDYNDFEKDFRRYEVQRERLYQALEVEKQKFEYREAMNIEDQGDDARDDIDLYR